MSRNSEILDRLAQLREADAPTHGGHVLSYVYDSGLAELDELAAAAMRLVQPVNGLDPTAFTSVAVMERELIGFARALLGGGTANSDEAGASAVVGTVTTGGTESCMLAVKTARDSWSGEGQPRLLAPVTVHAAFQKAAHYFGLVLDLVPVLPSGAVDAATLIARMAPDVALVVVSAPSYPHAALDPIGEVASAALAQHIPCHVDACIGGFVLPFWTGLPAWDLSVPGVTSISADLHKFGYAPKGASVLLQRNRDRQRAQYFATTKWPGYPVVNSTMLGSKSAAPLAAAWAITRSLGADGFRSLAQSCERSTTALVELVRSIPGLRVVGDPVGPLFAVATDESLPASERVDPHHWADEARSLGWVLQLQPAMTQTDGTVLPRTTHLTITPVTESVLGELSGALVQAADSARGVAPAIAELPPLPPEVDSATAYGILQSFGIGGGGLPARQAPLLAVIEALPSALGERLLIELLARLIEPTEPGA